MIITYLYRTIAARLSVILILLIGQFLIIDRLAAHGTGTLQVIGEPTGPYLLTVWTSPDPVRVGELHVTVGVAEPDLGVPILDAEIKVRVLSLDSGEPTMVARATSKESDNKYLYEADFYPQVSGQYLVTVISKGRTGSGSVDFNLEIMPYVETQWLKIGLAGLALFLFAALRFRALIVGKTY